MRVLAAVLCLAVAALAQNVQPKVRFFGDDKYLVQTREAAIMMCQNMNMHIAHESQLVMDIEAGFNGHHQCGWTWKRGAPLHVHCLETVSDSDDRCVSKRAEVRKCPLPENGDLPEPTGVYCRAFSDSEDRPRFALDSGDLVEIYRAPGPKGHNTLMTVDEAKAVCESEGNTLAYWSQVAAYMDRYGIRICQSSWLREQNAVYTANCGDSGEIGWDVRDPSRGYDAICYGLIPHKYIDPCTNGFEFQNLEGVPIHCSDDGYIIIQDRPVCAEEEYSFNQGWHQYKHGFGKITKGYWLGLEVLAKLTKQYNFKLVVEVTSNNGATYRAKYSKFWVDNLEKQFALHVEGYSGNAGDMFNAIQSNAKTSNGAKFSTYRRDNDGVEDVNCAREYSSGWWFQSCHVDNLNGPCPGQDGYSPHIAAQRTWRPVSNNTPGLRTTRMKIRYTGDD